MKVIVTRPRAQAQPLVGRLEELGLRGRRVPADRDRPHLRRADRLRRLRVGGRHEPERRRRGRAPGAQPARRSPPSGPGTAETLRKHGIEPAFVASVSTAGRLVAEFPKPDGKVIFLAAENSRRGPIDSLEADFVPLYSTVLLEPEPPDGRRRRARLGLGRARLRLDRRQGAGGLDRPGDDAASRARSGSTVAVEAETHDLDGLVAAVGEFARRPLAVFDYITFLTDFGLQDDFVGVCRGVMKRIARDAADPRRHARDRAAGGDAGRARARALGARTCRRPSTSRSSIPASAASRRAVAIRTGDGRVFVGPDNGLLDARRRPRRRRGRAQPHEPALPPRARSRRRSRRATCSRRSPRTSRPAPTSTTSATRSIRRRSCASSCPSPRSSGGELSRPCSTSTASATSG